MILHYLPLIHQQMWQELKQKPHKQTTVQEFNNLTMT